MSWKLPKPDGQVRAHSQQAASIVSGDTETSPPIGVASTSQPQHTRLPHSLTRSLARTQRSRARPVTMAGHRSCPCCPAEPPAAIPLRPPEASLAPAERLWSADAEGAVRLKMEEAGPAADAPRTVHQMFLETVEAFGERPAVASKKDGQWQTLTWSQYYRECRTAAKSFIKVCAFWARLLILAFDATRGLGFAKSPDTKAHRVAKGGRLPRCRKRRSRLQTCPPTAARWLIPRLWRSLRCVRDPPCAL